VVLTMAAGARVKYFEMQGYSIDQARELFEPLRIDVKPLFNTTETYGDFLIPGILALILQQTLLMGLSESIAKEREAGTMGDLFATAGRSMWALMSGKGAFYLALFSAYAFFFYTVNFQVFSIPFRGSALALAILTMIFLLSVVYLSLFLSSFFHRKMIALQILGFTSYPIFPDLGIQLAVTGIAGTSAHACQSDTYHAVSQRIHQNSTNGAPDLAMCCRNCGIFLLWLFVVFSSHAFA